MNILSTDSLARAMHRLGLTGSVDVMRIYIAARGYTTTVADFNALFELMKEYRERVREGLSSENKSVLSKMETIAYYQKNRLNPFTYDIRRIKNGGIS